MARKICVFSGSRADYGLLCPLLGLLRGDPAFSLQLVVSGSHLDPRFGETVRAIAADGFAIDAEVEILSHADSRLASAEALGRGTIELARVLTRLAPDIALVLGDRYEALAFAQAAMMLTVPLAHIHGGETTEGAIDEAVRHAVSKMAHLHFVTAEPHRRRVVQLGEHPDRVYTVGAPGLDAIAQTPPAALEQLRERTGLPITPPFVLVTYHPVTLARETPARAVDELFDALDRVPDLGVLATMANADAFGRFVNRRWEEFAAARSGRVWMTTSLGQANYLSAMRLAEAVVGNSSSGLIEAPVIGTPTVNIGDRQRGRLRAPSVVDCAEDAEAIVKALATARTQDFKAMTARCESPYGRPGASRRIADILKQVPLDDILQKRFYELPAAS